MSSPTALLALDDIQLPKLVTGNNLGPDKAFGWAGYVVPLDGLKRLLKSLDQAKAAAGLSPEDPVKRSPDDSLRKVYHRIHGGTEGNRRFQALKRHALDIGDAVIPKLSSTGAKVVACTIWPYSSTPTQAMALSWAFESLIQRVGLESEGRSWADVLVVIDRPPNKPDSLNESYRKGLHHGEASDGTSYYCGALQGRGFFGGLLLSATPYSPALQIADYVAGACRDFLLWCWTKKDKPRAKRTFGALWPAMRKYRGKIDRAGFLIHPDPGFSVDDKIARLMN